MRSISGVMKIKLVFVREPRDFHRQLIFIPLVGENDAAVNKKDNAENKSTQKPRPAFGRGFCAFWN